MVAAVPRHSVVVPVQFPAVACSAPAGDTAAAARQNTLISF
jgi:hypothetical protein